MIWKKTAVFLTLVFCQCMLSAGSAFAEGTEFGAIDMTKWSYNADAGCRGRDAGAPAGVTDLKAAVRFLRFCDESMPGDAERIFTFGMSGGGAQSALMGATGDSELYTPYLEQIGAVMDQRDAVYGSMCWCPITNLDTADESYEWMMGCTRSGLSDEEQAISDALANAWADYISTARESRRRTATSSHLRNPRMASGRAAAIMSWSRARSSVP